MAVKGKILQPFLITAAGALVLIFPDPILLGVKRGIEICLTTVIPSLFLFMIVSELLSRQQSGPLFWIFSPLCRLFSLPKPTAPVLCMSAIGGYPMGAKMLSYFVKNGTVSPSEAARTLCFAYQCSPAFLISAVGAGVFHSPLLGWLLYGCQLLASMLLCTVLRFFWKKGKGEAGENARMPQTSFAVSFTESVTSAGKAMGLICFFVTAFSAIYSLLVFFFGERLFFGLLEVSVGAASLASLDFSSALFWSVLFTSFGGICVILQIFCFVKDSGISLKPLLLTRPFHCLLSYLFARAALSLFPQAVNVFSSFSETEYGSASASAAASALLIALCLMLLISDKNYDKIK